MPAAAPAVFRITWNLEATVSVTGVVDSVTSVKPSSRLKRATRLVFMYATRPPAYFTRTFSTA